MQSISSSLATELNDGSQTVKPKVEVTWADSSFLNNCKVFSSSEWYEDAIKKAVPKLWYRMGDVANTMNDYSGNGIDGDYFGSFANANGIEGNRDGANNVYLRQSTDFLASGTGFGQVTEGEYGSTILRLTDNFTVECWAMMDTTTIAERDIVFKGSTTTLEYKIMVDATGVISGAIRDSGGTIRTVSSTVAMGTNTWRYIVMTRSGSALSIWVDGFIRATINTVAAGNIPGTNADLAIARAGASSANYWDGKVAEVAIYDRVLTESEIYSHWECGVRYVDVHTSRRFTADQAFNGKQRASMKWAIVDGKNQNGEPICCDQGYRVIDAVNNENYEYGWWAKRKSASNGTTDEKVWAEFDDRLANHIEVYTSEHYPGVNTYQLFYKNTSNVWVQVGATHTMPAGNFMQSHALGSALTIRGVRVIALSTRVGLEPARIQEISPIYKTDISADIVDMSIDKQRDNYDSTVPLGITAANTFNITLNNTTGTYNLTGAGTLVPYLRKDAKFDVWLGWDFQGVNLFQNGSFETDADANGRADSWSAFGTNTFALDTGTVFHGTTSQKITYSNDLRLTGQAITVPSAGEYTISMYVFIPSDWDGGSIILSDDGTWTAKTTIDQTFSSTTEKGVWKRIYITYKFTTDLSGTLLLRASTAPTAGKFIYVDAAQFELGSSPSPFSPFTAGQIEYVKQGEFWADDWSADSASMTTTCSARDFSKFLQDEPQTNGVLLQNVTAGQGVAELAARGNVPLEKIVFVDTWKRQVTNDRPYAWWRFSETTGTTLNDQLGVSQGVIAGSPVLGSPGPIVGEGSTDYALRFDGTDDYVTVSDNNNLDLTTTWTIEFWIKLYQSIGAQQGIVCKDGVGLDTTGGYNIYINTNGTFTYETNNVDGFSSTGSISNDGNWHHVVLTFDNAASPRGRWYIDSVAAGTGTATAPSNIAQGLLIGRRGVGNFFTGFLGELVLYKKALTAAQVAMHYRCGKYAKQAVFPFLYSKDESVWDAMLNWSTADLGMFYFDELNNFNFENGPHYYDTSDSTHTQHTNVQYNLSDSTNIIDGSQVSELQANVVVVQINPKTTINVAHQSIWRAEGNASLAVTTLTGAIGRSDGTISVPNTDSPLWLDSGWFKIDDEIISYTGKTFSSFTGCKRAQFGTSASNHSAGAKVREHRVYEIEYSNAPAIDVDYPHITAKIEEGTVEIDEFIYGPYKATIRVSATTAVPANTIVYLEGTDPSTELNYYFAVAGLPITEQATGQASTSTVSTKDSVRRYKTKKIEISNDFIQSKEQAQVIIDFLLTHFQNPVPILDVNTLGIPHLQVGDRVRITSLTQLGISNRDYWIIGINIVYNGGVSQSLHLREVS